MSSDPQFKKAFPYQKDALALPVTDLDAVSRWYCAHSGMVEVERVEQPVPTVVLERDGTRIATPITCTDSISGNRYSELRIPVAMAEDSSDAIRRAMSIRVQ